MKQSSGILLYRKENNSYKVFLVHPGGPFWKNKDLGTWSVPKGEFSDGEDPLQVAFREFEEETGQKISGKAFPLRPVKLKSGKLIHAWAIEGDADALNIKSNTFETEWPPKSGKIQEFPEVDKAGWFEIGIAKSKLNPGQVALLDQLQNLIDVVKKN